MRRPLLPLLVLAALLHAGPAAPPARAETSAADAMRAEADARAARQAEWQRRNAKYAGSPYYIPPGPVDVYDNPSGKGEPIARVPTGIKFLVLSGQADWYPKIYVPCMDVEGWFDRMQLCAYKGHNVVLDNNEIQKLENELFDKSWNPDAQTAVPTPDSPPPEGGSAPPAPPETPDAPPGGTGETPVPPPPVVAPPAGADRESVEYKTFVREEKLRRAKKYEGKPETTFPWLDLTIYKEQDLKEPVAVIPKAVKCKVISDPSGWNVKIYCPAMDVEGWFDRMILCAFKGVNLTVDWTKVYEMEEKLFERSIGARPADEIISSDGIVSVSTAPPAGTSRPPATEVERPPATPVAKPPARPATPAGTPPTAPPQVPPATETAAPPATPPAEPEEKPIMQATNTSGLKVFVRVDKTPNAASPVQIPPGATVNVLRREGDWCYIEFQGKKGFVRSFYIGLGK